MARPFKIFLAVVGGFIALVAAAAIALPLLFNPNDYKDEAAKAVRDATGRELAINGDIELTLFPWLGASVAEVTLGNAQGFGPEPFVQVAKMNVGVRLMPLLLDRQVRIGTVRIDGLRVNLAKAADGTSNWADLSKAEPETAGRTAEQETAKTINLTVGGLQIKDALLSYTDRQSGAAYKLENLSLETGSVELNKPLDLNLQFLLTSAQPQLSSEFKLALTALANPDTKVFEARDLKLELQPRGKAIPGGQQSVSLRGHARYDQNQDAFAFENGVLEAAGLRLDAAIQGTGMTGETPRLSGKLKSNTFNPRAVAQALGIGLPPTADPSALSQASFAANYSGDFNSARLDDIILKLDQTVASGTVSVRDFATQAIQFALKADALDADRYLAPATPRQGKKGGDGGDFKNTEIPIEGLDQVNANGTVDLGTLKLKGLTMTGIKLTLAAPKGQVKTQQLSAQLYGGRISQTARITPGARPRYDLTLGLDSINAGPLQQDFIGKKYLSGLGNLNFNLSTAGRTVGDILKALNGALATSFRDGAVEGFNLDETLGKARALYRGEPLPASSGPARTEFKDLKGSGKIVNGVLNTDTLNVKGSWYNLDGDGEVDLVQQQVNYVLYPSISGGGDKYKELQGTRIPVRITGSWFDPKIKVDLQSVLKGKVKEEIKQQEERLKEKARDRLGDFLRKNLPSQPAPKEPAPPAEPTPDPPPSQ